MKLLILMLTGAVGIAQTPTPGSDQNGGVAGIVRDSVTHQPVKKAIVTASPMQFMGGGQGQNAGPKSASTDISGTFSIDNLPPGRYRLQIQHQNYPQARNGAVSKNITVNPGEKAGPVEVDLIPGATISGRVLDEDGDSLNGCFVQLHPAAHPEQGANMAGGGPIPGSDGEYRLYGVAPGKYILNAQCNAPPFQARPFSAGPDAPPSLAYQLQYYPLTADAKSAQVIELMPASERTGVDFRMLPVPATFVHVTYAPPGIDTRQMQLQMLPADPKAPRNFFMQRPGPNNEGIRFERVFPGSYMLLAFTNGENQVGAAQRIDVKDRPVATVLELRQGVDINGTVLIEGNNDGKLTLNQINLQLVPEYPIGGRQVQAQVNNDGTFTLKSVLPAPWNLIVSVPGAYVKSAMLGTVDITDKPFDFSGASEPLKLVLSTNMATIRGTAPAGNMVWAVRDGEPRMGTTAAQADQNGQFTIPQIAPGKYRIVTAESQGPFPAEGGVEATVREGESITVDVKPQQ